MSIRRGSLLSCIAIALGISTGGVIVGAIISGNLGAWLLAVFSIITLAIFIDSIL